MLLRSSIIEKIRIGTGWNNSRIRTRVLQAERNLYLIIGFDFDKGIFRLWNWILRNYGEGNYKFT